MTEKKLLQELRSKGLERKDDNHVELNDRGKRKILDTKKKKWEDFKSFKEEEDEEESTKGNRI